MGNKKSFIEIIQKNYQSVINCIANNEVDIEKSNIWIKKAKKIVKEVINEEVMRNENENIRAFNFRNWQRQKTTMDNLQIKVNSQDIDDFPSIAK